MSFLGNSAQGVCGREYNNIGSLSTYLHPMWSIDAGGSVRYFALRSIIFFKCYMSLNFFLSGEQVYFFYLSKISRVLTKLCFLPLNYSFYIGKM